MPSAVSSGAPAALPRRRTGCLEWFAAVVVLLIAFGYFVVYPITERAVRGALEVLGVVMEGLAAIVARAYDDARQHVEESPQAKQLFGEPVQCPPVEEVTWLNGSSTKKFEFTFAITGPKGAGEAHATATTTETKFEITALEITGPGGDAAVLLPARPDSKSR